MKNQKYEGHLEATQRGGHVQSQIEWTCPRCGKVKRGNGFKGRHINLGKGCNGSPSFSIESVQQHFEELKTLINQTVNYYEN